MGHLGVRLAFFNDRTGLFGLQEYALPPPLTLK